MNGIGHSGGWNQSEIGFWKSFFHFLISFFNWPFWQASTTISQDAGYWGLKSVWVNNLSPASPSNYLHLASLCFFSFFLLLSATSL
jgi:hypothetical protein